MSIQDVPEAALPLPEMRAIVADLLQPKPAVYWFDFLATILAGHLCFELVYRFTIWFPEQSALRISLQILFFSANCLLYYRAAMFVHELTHLRRGSFLLFRCCWNLLCGVPFLLPSFLYGPHLAHHRKTEYGTPQDGEYLALGRQSRWHMLRYVLGHLVVPPLAVFRFMVLGPLSWFVPPLRRWILKHGSTLVMNPEYVRPADIGNPAIIFLQEVLCFLWCVGMATTIVYIEPTWLVPFLIQSYVTAVAVLALNAIRTLGSHRYVNDGRPMTIAGQVGDSVTYIGNEWIRELWAPLGSGLHALHHLFPSLPYHALPEAHRRLLQHLPPDGLYRATQVPSLAVGIQQLLQHTAGSPR